MYKHILVPTDGSPLSERAVPPAVALAKALDAKVTGITVFPPFHAVAVKPQMVTDTRTQYEQDCERLGAKYLSAIEQAAAAASVPADVVRVTHDHPWEAILDTAVDRACDLIVMASHGRKGLAALVLGSETTKVLTHSRIPVLVCR